jgi:hypothetical protein
MTPDLHDPAANRRAAALLLHHLHGDALGLATVMADTVACPDHCAAGVIDVLCTVLLATLRGQADDDEVEARLLRVTARAALAEAST